MTIKSGMNPVHPGQVLREELDALGLSANALAKAIGVPANRVTAILNAERGITADTALRLGRYFGTTAQFWLNLQQTWQIRLAESKSGSRILEGIVPRRAEALRTAARQAIAASDQAAPMLKAIARNMALCDQLSAVETAIGLSASNQRMLRALANPFDELRSVGALQTTFGRELGYTAQWLTEYAERFRMANADHVSRLVAQLGTAPASTVKRLVAMKTPWLDVRNELGSVRRVLELRQIGEIIGSQATFSQSVAAQVRIRLGDWRPRITWPDNIWRDLAARADFYANIGFNSDLTDLPTPAFREATEMAGIRSKPPSLVDSYAPPVPSSPEADEEAAFDRTNEAHDWLQRFESHLRQFIDVEMTEAFGPNWPKHRLPNGMYDEWKAKKNAAADAGRPECALVAYADFADYSRIIARKDNWRQVFKKYFERLEDVHESFQRLHPIRLDTMHGRPISQDDELLLYVEVKRIMCAIES